MIGDDTRCHNDASLATERVNFALFKKYKGNVPFPVHASVTTTRAELTKTEFGDAQLRLTRRLQYVIRRAVYTISNTDQEVLKYSVHRQILSAIFAATIAL